MKVALLFFLPILHYQPRNTCTHYLRYNGFQLASYSTKISSCVKDMDMNCPVDIDWGTITNDVIEIRFVKMCLMAAGVSALLLDSVPQYCKSIVVAKACLCDTNGMQA